LGPHLTTTLLEHTLTLAFTVQWWETMGFTT
jgi:hypothetical protein